MHTTAKRFMALCGMVVVLVLVASITAVPACAASNGIYIAHAAPHYKHPSTGIIEDSGGEGSAVLGQSMTESATYSKALVEVDKNGNTYATIRLKMMDNIEKVGFQVDGSAVSATTMQENLGNNTADFRMRVNSERSIIRCNIYVTAMGREVVYYITLSNLQPGSGDFVTSVEVAPAETQPEPQPEEKPKPQETKPAEPKPTEPKATQPKTEAPKPVESTAAKPEETSVPTESTIPETVSGEADGLQEFDNSGNPVTDDTPEASDKGSMRTVIWVIVGVVAAAGIGAGVWYFGFYKKKK